MTALYISWGISLVLWALLTLMFINPWNRSLKIISFVVTFVPFLGPLWQIGLWIAFFNEYRDCSYSYDYDENGKQYIKVSNSGKPVVRDTPIGRFLFNEIDWKEVDYRKNREKDENN